MERPEDKRQCERQRYHETFKYALSVTDYWAPRLVEAEGTVTDICGHGRGIGFYTDYPLEPGHVIRIRKSEGNYIPAVVKWAEKAEENHRAGIYLFR